jgi:predicted RNA binding protein YcfA (HicA-like mRNA interferase family)
MPKLPRVSGRECAKALQNAGFRFIRQGKGDHMVYRRDNPFAQVTIPDHRELDSGTLRSIIRQAGLTVEQFIEFLD